MTFFCLKISQNVTFVRYLNSCMLRSLWQMWDSWFILVGKKAENVQEDVRCFILLSRIVRGGKMSVISSGPGNNPHWRSISIFVFAWEDKNLLVVQQGQRRKSGQFLICRHVMHIYLYMRYIVYLPPCMGPSSSLFPPDHLSEVELTLCCNNGQLILQVVRD